MSELFTVTVHLPHVKIELTLTARDSQSATMAALILLRSGLSEPLLKTASMRVQELAR